MVLQSNVARGGYRRARAAKRMRLHCGYVCELHPAQLDRLLRMPGMPQEVRDLEYPKETWPMYRAPMVRTVADLKALKEPTIATVDGVKFRVDAAHFGLIPYWAKADEVLKHRSTHNARSETLHEKPTYKGAWTRPASH